MIGCFVVIKATEGLHDPYVGEKGTITSAMGGGSYEVSLASGRIVRRHWENLVEIGSLE
jgi:hypothetical protein